MVIWLVLELLLKYDLTLNVLYSSTPLMKPVKICLPCFFYPEELTRDPEIIPSTTLLWKVSCSPFPNQDVDGRKREATKYPKIVMSYGYHVLIFLLSGNELNWPRLAINTLTCICIILEYGFKRWEPGLWIKWGTNIQSLIRPGWQTARWRLGNRISEKDVSKQSRAYWSWKIGPKC